MKNHSKFPWQPAVGSEESNIKQSRGIYITNENLAHMEPTNKRNDRFVTEIGWQFYAARPFLAGLFYWTGFDYRGESNPYVWPAVINQSGMVDLCGFPKDIFYYLKSWWGKDTVLHILPHWNWRGDKSRIRDKGKEIKVTVFSNCWEIELFLNNKSLGKKDMPINGYLEWNVEYQPGVLSAKGYSEGKGIKVTQVKTTGEEKTIEMTTDRNIIKADGEDVVIITVQVNDANGYIVL